ncbi:pyridoxal phosphate-dependent aminotransferase [Flavobacterium sp. CS20]|jgi:aspartate aminotransferase|uniref:pyridoxal phosphate-dependent aminotransferase n=1 Tax=Flavobacterium sp. CS20 TaxID=2775246 RepID=UPI001B39EC0B|nr:pyridoxal phosphate-dependent aminotransferase [Flavobacterium sp. CS20]QTY27381.1 pyridoxal phosphate-dependent aminotransferase [Flavobacterium sp. CS20]
MPKISSKGISMPESPIRKLQPFADQALKEGKHIYYLNIGQPDIKTPQKAINAVKETDIEILSYSPSQGFSSYINKLVRYYSNNGININEDNLIVTTGGSEALSFALGSITDFGDEIIIPEPFYANYNGFSTACGVKVVPVTSNLDNNFALPPITEFESKITNKTKAILLCNPGNPTGYLYTKEEIEAIADLALKHDIFILADEVYREFTYDGHKHHSIMSLERLKNHAIMVDSVSKRFSMCGARIGCLVSKNKDLMKTAMKFAQARLSPPTLAQIASEAALDVDDQYFESINAEYTKRRNTLVKGLETIKGVKVANPKGAFYCVVELPVENTEHFAQWLLEKFEYEGETIMVAPAAGFYSTPNTGLNQIRIAYVLEQSKLIKSINLLKIALEEYQK